MIRGVDVSSVQGIVDWASVAASGIRFAIIKCSTGNDPGIDPNFADNVSAAQANGLVVGAYHFGYPLPTQAGNPSRDPAAQASIAFEKCKGLGSEVGTLPPVVDLEWPEPKDWARWGCTSAQIRDWGLAYLDAAHSLWECSPIVYTYPDFWQHVASAGDVSGFADYPLWIADYAQYQGAVPSDGSSPRQLAPWTSWTLWQHDGNHGLMLPNRVDADFNVFNGDDTAFAQLIGNGNTSETGSQPT